MDCIERGVYWGYYDDRSAAQRLQVLSCAGWEVSSGGLQAAGDIEKIVRNSMEVWEEAEAAAGHRTMMGEGTLLGVLDRVAVEAGPTTTRGNVGNDGRTS